MKKMKTFFVVVVAIVSSITTIVTAQQDKQVDQISLIPQTYDMVIIAPDGYSAALEPLILHKNSIDIKTILKSTTAIYSEYQGRDLPEKIKFFIKDAFETWGISYVLLLGGFEQIPSRYVHVYFEYDYQTEWVFPSDLYFADIYFSNGSYSSWDTNNNDLFGEYNWSGNYDSIDFCPDIIIGRLPCTTSSEVQTVVNKIIHYEDVNAWTKPWFKNLVLVGGDSLLGDEYHVDEGEYVNLQVMNILTGFSAEKIWASNGKLNLAININLAINPGAGFVFFNGHGHTDRWATHPHESSSWIPPGSYKNSHIDELTNTDKPAIIISDACYHCAFHRSNNCFGWRFVKHPLGGAIGFLGGTDIDVSYGGEAIITKGIERLCLLISTNYMNGDACLGGLWSHGLQSYISDSMDEIDILTVEEFHLFGDPSLRIANVSHAPNKPARPSGPIKGCPGVEYLYSSVSTDPDDDALYYYFDWGNGYSSGWLGPYSSGEPVNASYTYEKRGTYKVKVKARDNYGTVSEWSEPLSVSMPKSYSLFGCRFLKIVMLLFEILKDLDSKLL